MLYGIEVNTLSRVQITFRSVQFPQKMSHPIWGVCVSTPELCVQLLGILCPEGEETPRHKVAKAGGSRTL